jgi:EpsI family protein
MPKFFDSTAVRLATVLLVAQGAVLYSSIRPEAIPSARPLSEFPRAIGAWELHKEGVVEPEIQDVLRADDVLTRDYANRDAGIDERIQPNLFIAAFRSQRDGKTPHSPKNCLPGSGWTQVDARQIPIDVGMARPIVVNRYEVQRGEARSLVLYWYQSRDRVVANEFSAKFWVVADAIRLNRTDTALVRVVVPIVNHDSEASERIAIDFTKAFYPTIREYLPK